MARVAANLLALAAVASLDDTHEMSMIALLLGLGAARRRIGNIKTVLGQDLHTRQAREIGGLMP